MVSVLFVDDETAGLHHLEQVFASSDPIWQATFVDSPFTALDLMADRHVDVVVASSRLSGMSAPSFFQATKLRHPRTARISLSEPGDRSATLSTLPVVNQCLSKACGPEVLAKVVAQTTRLQGTLFNEATQEVVEGMGSLPSLPSNLVALDTALTNEGSSLGQIAEIISGDVAMVSKVLQLVNSSFFGLRAQVNDVRQAVAYLGVEIIRDFAMASEAFRAFVPKAPLPDGWLVAFNAHSVAVADIAGRLVRTSSEQCGASVAGMLHGIGELVVAERRPDRLCAIDIAVGEGVGANEAETGLIGTTYPVIGAYLLSQWGVGNHVVEAVAFQREGWAGADRDPELSDVLRVADHLAAEDASHSRDAAGTEGRRPDRLPARVCPWGTSMPMDEDYLYRVGLLGTVRMYRQGVINLR